MHFFSLSLWALIKETSNCHHNVKPDYEKEFTVALDITGIFDADTYVPDVTNTHWLLAIGAGENT